MIRIAVTLVIGLFAAGTLAACTETLKSDELTDGISQGYEKQTGVKLTSIECDDEIEAKAGQKFTCNGTNEQDVKLEFSGEVGEKGDDDKYSTKWEIVRRVAPGSFFNEAVGKTISEQTGIEVSEVNCPDDIVVEADTEIVCEATGADGSSGKVKVTLTDENGGFTIGPA